MVTFWLNESTLELSFEENYVWLGSGFGVEKADQIKVQLWGN